MRLILLGAPGAGKGTQAERLSITFNIPKLSTGEMVRMEIEANTDLGKRIQDISNAGQLVSDDIIIEIVRKRLQNADCNKGFILDGFPRTIPQAEELEKILAELPDDSKTYVISFNVDESELVKRLSGRYTCRKCGAGYHIEFNRPKVKDVCDRCGANEFIYREDDREEAVKIRLKVYKDKTAPLIDYYKAKGHLCLVNGMQSIDLISNDLKSLVSGKNNKFAV